jgi:hypothetical protein
MYCRKRLSDIEWKQHPYQLLFFALKVNLTLNRPLLDAPSAGFPPIRPLSA